jgi:hypothetical protein
MAVCLPSSDSVTATTAHVFDRLLVVRNPEQKPRNIPRYQTRNEENYGMGGFMKNGVFWDIKTHFVLHRRHITSPLQSPAG